ncbi:mechanosensitive ion channel family protein [Acetonema longum]|uniref:Small mechanosensitive channel n=1 Tax=Acetonema longum DSM 6540 TaxID=1009370 RepID=F7NG59_9FIRM|nr:mechanosensitive ion channel family protein [Acetonema longum]EGO64977.1 small mechanosensitive channel [Acetonema longum DSM 6540]
MNFNLPELTEYFQTLFNHAHLARLSVSLGILGAFILLQNLFVRYIFRFFFSMPSMGNAFLLQALQKPLKHFFVFMGFYLGLKHYLPAASYTFLDNLAATAIVVFTADSVYTLIGLYAADEKEVFRLFNKKIDSILIPFFSKILRLLVIAMAFVVVASRWGYDINGFIAGLGLGGLAFALAAKDLLANIFSGVVIITDKPFSIGDWVKTGDVEGTVEDISFRSIRIRQFDASVVTIPNAGLINSPIINFSRRTLRRISFNLEVRYDTSSDKLKNCITRIEKMLLDHKGIDNKTIFVRLNSFGQHGLTILIYCFTATAVWGEYLKINEEVHFEIMKILEDEGVKIALPSQSVYLETRNPSGSDPN